jgi:hypothetical protein
MLAEHEDARVANVALVRRFIEAINDSWNPTRFVTAVGGAVVPPPTMTAGR